MSRLLVGAVLLLAGCCSDVERDPNIRLVLTLQKPPGAGDYLFSFETPMASWQMNCRSDTASCSSSEPRTELILGSREITGDIFLKAAQIKITVTRGTVVIGRGTFALDYGEPLCPHPTCELAHLTMALQ